MKTNFDQFENDRMINDPNNYKWAIFYFNRKDNRVMVPKRSKMMGWTLNFGNINAYLLMVGLVLCAILFTRLSK